MSRGPIRAGKSELCAISWKKTFANLKRSNDPSRCYIVNFSRKPIFGAGVGDFSPIGGYLEAEDVVFILDVNSDYRPWLIQRKRLFDAALCEEKSAL
jgi:Phytochelatin synthase